MALSMNPKLRHMIELVLHVRSGCHVICVSARCYSLSDDQYTDELVHEFQRILNINLKK